MKANQPKRKMFNDAVDLLTADAPDAGDCSEDQLWI